MISDLFRLIPLLSEFFDEFPAYELESTEFGYHLSHFQ